MQHQYRLSDIFLVPHPVLKSSSVLVQLSAAGSGADVGVVELGGPSSRTGGTRFSSGSDRATCALPSLHLLFHRRLLNSVYWSKRRKQKPVSLDKVK